jgi:chromosome segregation and condensation protein ScpB
MAYLDGVRSGLFSRQRLKVMQVLSLAWPITAGEVAARLNAKSRNNVAARLRELELMRSAEKVYEKLCPHSGKLCWTWQLTGNKPIKLERPDDGRLTKPELSRLEIIAYRYPDLVDRPILIKAVKKLKKKSGQHVCTS